MAATAESVLKPDFQAKHKDQLQQLRGLRLRVGTQDLKKAPRT